MTSSGLVEIPWQTTAMAKHDRRMAPVVLVLGLVLLAVPVGFLVTGQHVTGVILLVVLLLPIIGCVGVGVTLPRAAGRKLAATEALARSGTRLPARALDWTPVPREAASTEGELRLRLEMPDGEHVVLAHVCDWSDCEAAGRGAADRSLEVVVDIDKGVWSIVHAGHMRSWSAEL